jgi:hypothetical protein
MKRNPMERRLLIKFRTLSLLGCLALATPLWAATPAVDNVHIDPPELIVHEKTQITVSARVSADASGAPTKVRLMRLQWAGNEREVVRLRDDGKHGDTVKNDGIYTCQFNVKEPILGLLSFTVEALYSNHTRVRSKPIFIQVSGGVK